ncbi:MlaD family protein [Nocardia sp. NPDC003345]
MTAGLRLLVALLLPAALLAGCGFDPGDHALPGTGVGGPTYRLLLAFDSVLSLPAGAQVRSEGARVGVLTGVELRPEAAVAEIEVGESVRLPVGTRAELRRTTVLGDVHIALVPPPDAAPDAVLRDGDTIPLPDTDTGPQPEEMLARIAIFVNGGSVTRLQDAIARLDTVLPEPAETREMTAALGADLAGAAATTGEIDRILLATRQMSDELDRMRAEVGFVFSETARQRLDRVPEFMTAVLNVVIDVETLTTGLDWLIPRLPHLNTQLEQLAVLLREPSPDPSELRGNAGRVLSLAQTELVPFLRDPRIDLRTVTVAGNEGPAVDALVVLGMIGALP